jgi:hypothetical protein
MSGEDLVQLARLVAEQQLAPVRAMLADATVVTVDAGKAAVRVGGPSAEPVAGFAYSPSLDVQPGDHVLVYRLAGYQLILAVLNRNAVVGAGSGGGLAMATAFFLS